MASALAAGEVTVHAARHGPVNTLANADLPSVLRDNSPLALPVRPGRVAVLVEAVWAPTDLGARLLGWWSMQLAELVCVKLPSAGERTQLVDCVRERWGLA